MSARLNECLQKMNKIKEIKTKDKFQIYVEFNKCNNFFRQSKKKKNQIDVFHSLQLNQIQY